MKGNGYKDWRVGVLTLALAAACGLFPAGQAFAVTNTETAGTEASGAETTETAAGSSSVSVVEYDDLRELLKAGNFDLKQTIEDQDSSTAPYEEMRDILKAEQKEMEDMAEAYEDDGDTEMQEFYEERAEQLKTAASQVGAQLRNMNSASQTKSYEKQVDSLLVTAQTLMSSYNQMALQIEAQEKQAAASSASYEETVKRQAAGLVKSEEVDQAKNTLTSQENTLASLREQAAELKENLLTLLGLSGQDVEIGKVPEPDLEAIAAIDLEADKLIAVSNDKTYVSEINSKVTGTDAKTLKSERVENARAEELIDITSTYEELLNQQMKYEAAKKAFEAADLDYQALLRKKQAGMLSTAAYLEGEAEYASAKASMETAAMNLKQAHETYLWEVRGTV